MPDFHDELTTLLSAGPPLERDDWALDDEGLRFVVEAIASGRSTVIECGSGVSTVVIARALRRVGRGSVTALEHLTDHAATVRDQLAVEELERWARVIDAPLVDEPIAEPGCRWYSREALAELPERADLVLVDGPPASPEAGGVERARYPALPLLRQRLGPGCVVVLDDADREGERWVIEQWSRQVGVDLRPVTGRIAAGTIDEG